MNSSSGHSSRSSTSNERYRAGSSSGYYANIREGKDRKGNEVVIINHHRSSTAKDEPRSSDHTYSTDARYKNSSR